ncbi:class I SAM-dependent methyltransferase [bacterium]|nr:class I SAM-dependent methyltransferase [bacterium]
MSESYELQLHLVGHLTENAARQAIESMHLSNGTFGMDAGCGIGNHMMLLASEVGPMGMVHGVDTCDEKLRIAKKELDDHGFSSQVELSKSDIRTLPLDDDSIDWLWCADTLWPIEDFNPDDGIREFKRVLRPAGKLGLYFWTHQNLLPGYPLLESHLNLAYTSRNPYLNQRNPDLHFLNAKKWLKVHGFQNVSIRFFHVSIETPLSEKQKRALGCCMDMLWGNLHGEITGKDWDLFQTLRSPSSESYILNDPDYHAEIYYTLFQGSASSAQ